MTIAKKYAQSYMPNGEVSLEQVIQAAIDEATDKLRGCLRITQESAEFRLERIRQLEQERVPEGWKLVPIEPTKEMVDSILRYVNGEDLAFYGADELRKEIKKDWELLLAAAPAQEKK